MANQKHTVLDFFGNEIEVGDEVAYVESGYRNFLVGVVAGFTPQQVKIRVQSNHRYFTDFTNRYPNVIVVNTEKKHREKALDYLVQEAQEMGLYEDGVGVNTTKEGYE